MRWSVGGFRPWLVQRISAVYMAVFLVAAALVLMFNPPVDYLDWRGRFGSPTVWVATALFFLALLAHVWVGVRDILIDYVHPLALRFTLLTGVALGLLGLALWLFRALMSVVPS